ncbi:MAG: hypothetical protein C4576_03925 [Desulfobacteraceae bacterium]|nr:MAG: hypothetical protein C4576_03925 [Desulfobacteraceae bacterium]
MKMKRMFTLAITSLFLLGLSLPAAAQQKPPGQQQPPRQKMEPAQQAPRRDQQRDHALQS